MCADPGCPSDDPPPPGEKWCPKRIEEEYRRWIMRTYPMECGQPRMIKEMLAREPDALPPRKDD